MSIHTYWLLNLNSRHLSCSHDGYRRPHVEDRSEKIISECRQIMKRCFIRDTEWAHLYEGTLLHDVRKRNSTKVSDKLHSIIQCNR